MKNPEAWIAINKNRVRHYPAKLGNPYTPVYLSDNSEFQIELFNPTTDVILAKIFINGNSIGNVGMVLRPGERVFLDRFLNKKKKFKFSTYEVEDSNEARKAIEKNGRVAVRFFKRKKSSSDWYTITWGGTTGATNVCGCGGSCGCGGTYPHTYDVSPTWINSTTTGTLTSGTWDSTTISATTVNVSSTPTSTLSTQLSSIKTGRVEEGSKSNQKFTTVDYDFVEYAFHKVDIQLLPAAGKRVESSDIRNYCTDCGRRLKSSWRFCAGCGCEC